MKKRGLVSKIVNYSLGAIGMSIGLISKYSTWRLIIKSCLIGAEVIAIFTKKRPLPEPAVVLNKEFDTSFFKSEWEVCVSGRCRGEYLYDCFLLNDETVNTVDLSIFHNEKCSEFDKKYESWLIRASHWNDYSWFSRDAYENYVIKDTNPSEKYLWAYYQTALLNNYYKETDEFEVIRYVNEYPDFMSFDRMLPYGMFNYNLILYDQTKMFICVATIDLV